MHHNVPYTIFLAVLLTQSAAGQAVPKSDATFVFTADTHVAFDGTDDLEGFSKSAAPIPFLSDETTADPYNQTQHDACTMFTPSLFGSLGFIKDLCNNIQHIRKMNALTLNQNKWAGTPFTQYGHTRSLLSSGQPINTPLGVVIGGDLTDCAGGNNDDNDDCTGYQGANGNQLLAFRELYDQQSSRPYNFNNMSFLRGLFNPDHDVPLHYPIYPNFGNHDIDNPGDSSVTPSYLREWCIPTFLGGTRQITSCDPNSGAYSWDWGNLHIVNVGVYPGSQNNYTGHDNYTFSQDQLNWLQNDLQQYAGDGRPVIIASHYGFDAQNGLSSWNASDRVGGLNGLWTVLRTFNVIGFYHGHNHNQLGPYQYPTSSASSTVPLPKIPYDIFLPGAGYTQNFALTRVTSGRMDVVMTKDSDDFNNFEKVVNFGTQFTKLLAPAPRRTTIQSDLAAQLLTAYFQANGKQYLLSIDPFGFCTLRYLDSNAKPTVIALTILPGRPSMMTTYSLNGVGHVLVLIGKNVTDYQVIGNNIVADWSTQLYASSMMSFSSNYLLVDNTTQDSTFEVYQITSTGLTLMSTQQIQPTLGNQPFASSSTQMAVFNLPDSLKHDSSGTLLQGFSRYDGQSRGEVEFNSINLKTFAVSVIAKELWTKDEIVTPVQVGGNTEFLIQSNTNCVIDSNGDCVVNPESPYYIRTLLPDVTGTDVSWRGAPAAFPLSVNGTFILDQGGASASLGSYSREGIFITFALDAPVN